MTNGVQILQAYAVKEELRSLLALPGSNPERHMIRARLDNFYQQAAAAADAAEVRRLAGHHQGVVAGDRSGHPDRTSPTRDPRATTAWPNTKTAMPSGSAIRSTNADEYVGPVPAITGGPQP